MNFLGDRISSMSETEFLPDRMFFSLVSDDEESHYLTVERHFRDKKIEDPILPFAVLCRSSISKDQDFDSSSAAHTLQNIILKNDNTREIKVWISDGVTGEFKLTFVRSVDKKKASTSYLMQDIDSQGINTALSGLSNVTVESFLGAGTKAQPWAIKFKDKYDSIKVETRSVSPSGSKLVNTATKDISPAKGARCEISYELKIYFNAAEELNEFLIRWFIDSGCTAARFEFNFGSDKQYTSVASLQYEDPETVSRSRSEKVDAGVVYVQTFPLILSTIIMYEYDKRPSVERVTSSVLCED